MDWLERVNRAMDYIEENLVDEIEFKEVARLACCPEYHFPRMFSSMTGMTLSEYIRRRRLSLAAFELQNNSDVRIIDLALKYGYDSPDAFSRAFKSLHGVNPTAARNKGIELKAIPRLSFQISIKGAVEMDYRIEVLDFEIEIVGIKQKVTTRDAFQVIPKLWGEATENGLLHRLIDMSWEHPQCKMEGILGVVGKQAAITDEDFDYLMGCRYTGELPTDMEKIVLPKSTWAVFPNISEAWQRLYTEWLPTSGYELANLPCIENQLAPDRVPSSELWVPVIASK
ncbi:helix-turn-helix domain-containing protein [Metasolibacillus sp.]|uniref:AraC family transcriptional regulator n=1 Tax=Metasolibacillus sp. TaxID=2703680 RepID=UPI0025DDEEA0|nr:helix-turn-helix domain-containing protein [Metasolibacillus sp.]MCT6924820.1 AraC family transcriptional regulator [Metasolibacillus sp.]MCT6941088.1 AraC family transcriptional regulator [Metasolibacillus sp.]